jgi:DNA-binding MarR family transcriptional regulator
MSDTSLTDSASVMRQLSFAFLTWRRHQQRRLSPFSITLQQLHVLRQLARNDYLYPSKIAEMLYCDRPTATVVIRNISKRGWVARERDEQDRRQIRVILTDKGRAKLDQIIRSRQADVNLPPTPLDSFSQAEIAELNRLLTKLNDSLKQTVETKQGASHDPTK